MEKVEKYRQLVKQAEGARSKLSAKHDGSINRNYTNKLSVATIILF
jgi:hypothetical protein